MDKKITRRQFLVQATSVTTAGLIVACAGSSATPASEVPAEAEASDDQFQIRSMDQLFEKEEDILELINEQANGGNLFITHPFMLLEDIGVKLSNDVRGEIVQKVPEFAALSVAAYNALRNSNERQIVRVHLHGLFERS